MHVQGDVPFVLHCGNYKTTILAWVFLNLHEELILGISWLVKENSMIDSTVGPVIVERDGAVSTLLCYHQCLNIPTNRKN